MKVLLIFQSGTRKVCDTMAVITTEPVDETTQKISLERATEDEIASLTQNPNQDDLIASIEKR